MVTLYWVKDLGFIFDWIFDATPLLFLIFSAQTIYLNKGIKKMPKNGPLNQLYSNHVLYCTCSNLQFEYSAGIIALRVNYL